jgi:4-amino-4-deoxy-L-arabinose transferase-like glycosyltransferase
MTINNISQQIKKNWLLIVIFLLATVLRTWDVPNEIILFDDAAYDIRVAQQAVLDKEIPLLGIPSSVPRFRQGPVTVWMNMVLSIFFGFDLSGYALFYIFLSLACLVLVYEFSDRYLNEKVSLITTTLISFSPFAIAQARMPYHTNPIPLAVILYLFALVRLHHQKKYSMFFAFLSWAFLFQFELAVFPTILLIPFVLYRSKQLAKIKTNAQEIISALLIGLLPQLIYDVQNKFSQLGLFIIWVGYRVISLFGGTHSFGSNKIKTVYEAFTLYGGRIFSVNISLINLLFLGVLLYSFYLVYRQWKQKKRNVAIEIVAMFTIILSIGYLAHGGPSEAYFPPFIVLLPLLAGFSLEKIFRKRKMWLLGFLIIYSLMNIRSIFDHNFFVSNNQSYSYSYSVGEQKAVVNFILEHSGGDYQLDTTRELRKFKSAFDNLRFLSEGQGVSENKDSKKYYYIENKNSLLKDSPMIKVEHFPSVDVYYYEQ